MVITNVSSLSVDGVLKIWIDVLTPKQLLFFKPLIAQLQERGHHVIATSRHYREVEGLAPIAGLSLELIGRHGGAALREKLEASVERSALLAKRIAGENVDCAVSFSSPECARVAFGLGVKHICINDSPHAESVGRLTIPLSSMLVTPWIIPLHLWTRFGITRNRITRYRALDPAAWLKRLPRNAASRPPLALDWSKRTVTVRLEESSAAYMLSNTRISAKMLVNSLAQEHPDCNIIALCRYKEQVEEFSQGLPANVYVPAEPVDGVGLLRSTDVFVGLGGTMTAEAALLGVPTVSAFMGGSKVLVLGFLARRGLVQPAKDIRGIIRSVAKYLEEESLRTDIKKKAQRLLNWMEDPVEKVLDVVEQAGVGKA